MSHYTRAERLAFKPNRVLERIRAGGYALCSCQTPYPSPKITEMMGLIQDTLCLEKTSVHLLVRYNLKFLSCMNLRRYNH